MARSVEIVNGSPPVFAAGERHREGRIPGPGRLVTSQQLRLAAFALAAIGVSGALQAQSIGLTTASGHAVVNTATGLVGVLVTFIAGERARALGRSQDFLIAVAFGILSCSDLAFGVGPVLVSSHPALTWETSSVIGRLLGTGILAGAAFSAGTGLGRSRRARIALIATVGVGLATVAAGALILSSVGHGSLLAAFAAKPGTSAPALLTAVQLAGALLALLTVIGFSRPAADQARGLVRSLAVAGVVLAVARVDYALGATLPEHWPYAADTPRLIAYLVILLGCAQALRSDRSRLTQAAALHERRRMARDMHDGLAQELAFIASHAQRLGQNGDDATIAAQLRGAAERALHESRLTIAVLTSAPECSMHELVARTAESFRARFHVDVHLDLAAPAAIEPEKRNALLRVLHEALTNAVRHGGARHIGVSLSQVPGGVSLRICDDGQGFDPEVAAQAKGGLGLISMRERVELLGGTFTLHSSPHRGAMVEAVCP
jgi:signal transduction histidine kinase